jgi:SOS-response transcriptional repressor LexA
MSTPRAFPLPLSPRQQDVRDAIASLTRRLGYSPSLREIADAVGISRSRAAQVCREAVRRGAIEHDPGVGRSWRVVRQSTDAVDSLPRSRARSKGRTRK